MFYNVNFRGKRIGRVSIPAYFAPLIVVLIVAYFVLALWGIPYLIVKGLMWTGVPITFNFWTWALAVALLMWTGVIKINIKNS
jgi:hypothetical protein